MFCVTAIIQFPTTSFSLKLTLPYRLLPQTAETHVISRPILCSRANESLPHLDSFTHPLAFHTKKKKNPHFSNSNLPYSFPDLLPIYLTAQTLPVPLKIRPRSSRLNPTSTCLLETRFQPHPSLPHDSSLPLAIEVPLSTLVSPSLSRFCDLNLQNPLSSRLTISNFTIRGLN